MRVWRLACALRRRSDACARVTVMCSCSSSSAATRQQQQRPYSRRWRVQMHGGVGVATTTTPVLVTSRRGVAADADDGSACASDGDDAGDGDDGNGRRGSGQRHARKSSSSSLSSSSAAATASAALPRLSSMSSTADSFYDSLTRRCTLCDESLSCTYKLHTTMLEHSARSGVYDAALRDICAHLRLLELTSSPPPRQQQQQQQTAATSSSTPRPALDEDVPRTLTHGLPSLHELRRHPALLRRVNWTDAVLQSWWRRLYGADERATRCTSPSSSSTSRQPRDFDRLLALSSHKAHVRRARMRYLLQFLRQRQVLRHSFLQSNAAASTLLRGGGYGVAGGGGASSSANSMRAPSRVDAAGGGGGGSAGADSDTAYTRSVFFERCEMIGDNVIKACMYDRIACLFASPATTTTSTTTTTGTASSSSCLAVTAPTIDERLWLVQQLLDSNAGLRAIYDYLQLDRVTGMHLPNNKTKSDVVEAVIGELHMYVWSCDVHGGCSHGDALLTSVYAAVPTRTAQHLRALVAHTLNELVHTVIMWRLESTLGNAHATLMQRVPVEDVQRRLVMAAAARYQHRQRHTRGQRNSSDNNDNSDSGDDVYVCDGSDDALRYTLQPALLPDARRRMTTTSSSRRLARDGRDDWYYSTHLAPTRAPAHVRELLPTLLPDEVLAPTEAWCAHYQDSSRALHVVSRRGAYVRAYTAALRAQQQQQSSALYIHGDVSDDVCDGAPTVAQHVAAQQATQSLCWTATQLHALLQRRLAALSSASSTLAHDGGAPAHDVAMTADCLHATPTPRPTHVDRLGRRRALVQCVVVALGGMPS